MVSIRTRVSNSDNLNGGRNVEVSLGSFSLKSPFRTPTNKDYKAASALPMAEVRINAPLTEYVVDFDNNSLNAFLVGNGSLKRRTLRMQRDIDMMRRSSIVLSIQTPNSRLIPRKDIQLFFELLQKHTLIKIISIPPFEYDSISIFQQEIISYSERALARGQEVMPILHIGSNLEKFTQEFAALRELHESGICNVIGFKYADPLTYARQFLEIWDNRDEEIWYHCFGIPRTKSGRKTDPLARIHVVQNWGIDSFSPIARDLNQKQIQYLVLKAKSISPSDVAINRFDSPTLGILKEQSWVQRYGHDLHCGCPACHSQDLQEFKERYTHELNGNFNPNILRQANKIHEFFSGKEEFEKSFEAIKSDDLPSYFGKKEFSKGRIQPPVME